MKRPARKPRLWGRVTVRRIWCGRCEAKYIIREWPLKTIELGESHEAWMTLNIGARRATSGRKR